MPEGYKQGQPDVHWWLTQIKLGEQYRREHLMEDQWPVWRNYYRGRWRSDILPSNIFFKMLRTVVPRIYFRNPSVSIITRKPGIENLILSQLLERTHNKLLRNMKMKQAMKSQVQSAFQWGAGVGKLGFGAEFTPTPKNLGITAAPRVGRNLVNRIEYSSLVESNFPWYKHAPTDTFVLPEGTKNKEDARWEAFYFRRPLEDVKADPRLRHAKELKGSPKEVGGKKVVDTRSIEEIDLYEVRDKKTGKVFIITPNWQDKPLMVENDDFTNLDINNSYLLTFNEDDESVWGVPDSQILEPLQREINEVRTFQMYHRRISIVKMLVKRGAIKPEEALKMISSDVNPLVWVDDNNLSDVLRPVEAGGIPDSLLAMDNIVMQDVRETVGFSRNEFGEFRQGARAPTKFETQVVKAASDLRVEERRDMVADMLTDIIKAMNPLIFEHWQEEEVVEMVGPGGVPIWVFFRPTMLDRRLFEVNVDPDTSMPQTKDVREQKALQMYQMLRQDPLIDPIQLTRYLLHELHGVQFDDMMSSLPPGAGLTPDQPLSPDQFGGLLQSTAQRFPQLASPNVNRAAQEGNGADLPA